MGFNRYSYALNNPLSLTDPDGHCAGVCVTAAATALTVGVLATMEAYDNWRTSPEGEKTIKDLADAFNRAMSSLGDAIGDLVSPAANPTGDDWRKTGAPPHKKDNNPPGDPPEDNKPPACCPVLPGDGSPALEGDPYHPDSVKERQEQSNEDYGGRDGRAKGPRGDYWDGLQNYRGGIRTNGLKGKKKEYYEWDYTHNDVEAYNSRGDHLGTRDPNTGERTKDPVEGRDIRDKL